MSLISELKRRNIFRVALLYIVLGWLLLQIAAIFVEQLGMPGWIFRFAFGLLVICFPLALIFSWMFEITPEGLKREQQIIREQSITRETGKKLDRFIVMSLLMAIALTIVDQLV